MEAARGSNAHALNNRGALRLELGEAQKALPDFHAALTLDPWYETARRNRDAALSEFDSVDRLHLLASGVSQLHSQLCRTWLFQQF